MGKQRMEQNWERVRTQIFAVWGEIDDKELKKARGNLNKMVNLIHEKTGEDRTLIMQKMSAVI
ncbi:MAG: general stress protein CsbD [Bacteroidota bacterium]